MMPARTRTWSDTVAPLAARLNVAATFGLNFHFNPRGSKNLSNLLRDMAGKLDRAAQQADSR